MNARQPGRARLSANLDRVPANEATGGADTPKKSGVELVREKGWQRDADSTPETRVRVVDHDNNRVLFDGTEAEHRALKKALAGGEE